MITKSATINIIMLLHTFINLEKNVFTYISSTQSIVYGKQNTKQSNSIFFLTITSIIVELVVGCEFLHTSHLQLMRKS